MRTQIDVLALYHWEFEVVTAFVPFPLAPQHYEMEILSCTHDHV